MAEYTYEDKLAFIKNLYCPARQVAAESGCSWELILAQAAQETGWGEKVLPGTNNIFNIKADSSWQGESKVFRVWEVDKHDRKIWVNDPFRVYPTTLDALRDRQKFLAENPRYGKAGLYDADVKGDLVGEAKALQKAGYATDPAYAHKLEVLFKGPSMRRAIAAAKKEGCKGCLPSVNVRVLDAARVPIAKAKLKVTQGAKTAEMMTDADGRAQIQAAQPGGTVTVQVWSEHERQWAAVDHTVTPTTPPTAVTLIAPTITVATTTDLHKPPKTAPKAPAGANAGSGGAAPASGAGAATAASAPQAVPKAAPAPAPGAGHVQHGTYTIRRGDSLSRVAKAHSTSYIALAHLNGIESPYYIYPGQVLKVPLGIGGTGAAPVPATTAKAAPATKPAPAAPAAGAPHTASTSAAGRPAATTPAAAATPPAAAKPPASGAAPAAQPGLKPGSEVHVVRYRSEADHPQTDLMLGRHAPWMVVAEREFKAGVRRRGGKNPDQHILEYFTATSAGRQKTDTIAYCAAFVNWCLTQAGFEGNRNAMAISLAKWGRPTRDNKPAYGAVAIVHFPEGGHHVTFVNGKARSAPNALRIATLGGNQGHGHEVSHSALPASWVVHYRLPTGYVELDEDYDLQLVQVDGARMSAASTH
ncbi:TIGR02594 family protein [Burkholderia stagnalis]|uniref:TIGR02594 family protein n=1 Tax=Burkholderia stagnalis TaxID=1503054 RepID=UPI0007550601|nr:TIGR02594 family protein [Burkholderia stagnalis]KVX51702.1 flagellar biosynthesis protein FlgJ [Burkholderia stagnalis]